MYNPHLHTRFYLHTVQLKKLCLSVPYLCLEMTWILSQPTTSTAQSIRERQSSAFVDWNKNPLTLILKQALFVLSVECEDETIPKKDLCTKMHWIYMSRYFLVSYRVSAWSHLNAIFLFSGFIPSTTAYHQINIHVSHFVETSRRLSTDDGTEEKIINSTT